MNSQQILQISFFGLFVGGYSIMALYFVGRAMIGSRVLSRQTWKAQALRLRRAPR
jgi:hypothetical protein